MIQPGLERIGLLLKDKTFPWKSIHVAGTNGKGSICQYASNLVKRRTLRVGKFTSPHLVDRWDCIQINEEVVEETKFKKIERHYETLSQKENIGASPFEILTATAFHMFNDAKIDVGVIEVGMGGKLDATNILNNQVISVISKISMDHQGFLGTTLEEIARHKAGILRPNVPFIINPMNEYNIQDVIVEYAKEIGAGPRLYGESPDLQRMFALKLWQEHARSIQPFMRDNIVLAIVAVKVALKVMRKGGYNDASILEEVKKKRCTAPGRLEYMRAPPVFGRLSVHGRFFLVDGAHNPDAAAGLARFVFIRERKRKIEENAPPKRGWPVTWVLAMSQGKDAAEYLRTILKHGDNVVTTSFGAVDGMPWVKPMDPKELLTIAKSVSGGITGISIPNPDALRALMAARFLTPLYFPIVVTGSLYLVGDLHRALRGNNRFDYWVDPSKEAHHIAMTKMRVEERNRVNRLLSGENVDSDNDSSDQKELTTTETPAQRKQRLRKEIEDLDKEMENLATQEQQLSQSQSSSADQQSQLENRGDESESDSTSTSSPIKARLAKTHLQKREEWLQADMRDPSAKTDSPDGLASSSYSESPEGEPDTGEVPMIHLYYAGSDNPIKTQSHWRMEREAKLTEKGPKIRKLHTNEKQ